MSRQFCGLCASNVRIGTRVSLQLAFLRNRNIGLSATSASTTTRVRWDVVTSTVRKPKRELIENIVRLSASSPGLVFGELFAWLRGDGAIVSGSPLPIEALLGCREEVAAGASNSQPGFSARQGIIGRCVGEKTAAPVQQNVYQASKSFMARFP